MKQLVNQKLRPLHPFSTGIIRRERLERQIQENLDKKLILLIAQAGSGKTTLVSSAIEGLKGNHIWVSLGTSNQDISSFAYDFISNVRTVCPWSFRGFEKKIKNNGRLFENPALLASYFTDELSQHSTPAKRSIVVLDHFKMVNGSLSVAQFLDHVLERIPSSVTFILCGTQIPNIGLSKLALRDELHQVDGLDLALNLEEIQELSRHIYHTELSSEDLKLIYEKTEGWVTGVILFLQHLRKLGKEGQSNIGNLLNKFNGCRRIIYRYFLENVFQDQPEHIKKFLCKTALLDYLVPDICSRALGVEYSERVLETLVDNNLFTYYIDSRGTPFPTSYRYHPLMREFLLKKLYEDFTQEEIEGLQSRIGEILAPIDPENAIKYLLSSKCFIRVIDILKSIGEKMLHECRFRALGGVLNSIPVSYIARDPALLYFSGRIAELQGETDKAFEYFERASNFFEKQTEIPSKIECLNSLSAINVHQETYRKAKNFIQNEIQCLESQCIERNIAHKLITGYTNLTEILLKLDESQKAESYLQKAKGLYDYFPKPDYQVALIQCQSLKHMVEGDLVRAIEVAKEGESLALELNFPVKLRIFYHYLAFSHLHLGHFSQSIEYALRGLEYSKRFDIEDNLTAALFAGLGQALYALSEYDQAIKNLDKSLMIFQKGHNSCGSFWSNHALYHIFLKREDKERARRHLRILLHTANSVRFPLEVGMARIDLANFLLLKGEEKGVFKLIENGKSHLKQSIKKMSIFLGNLLAARAYIKLGHGTAAESLLLESFHLIEGNNLYLFGIHQERNWLPAFLQRFVPKIPICRKLLHEYQNMASDSSEIIKETARVPDNDMGQKKENVKIPNLRIYGLGPFRVFVENDEIPLHKCKSRKALTLLKYLFFARNNGPVSKDILLELLWPNSAPQKADLNFRVTLSQLRKILSIEQNGPRYSPNLLRKGNEYEISLGSEGWSDVDEFISEMKLAQYKEKKGDQHEALRHYLNAEKLYKGDFLMENLYEDWCFMEREHLRAQFLYALTKILNYYDDQHNLPEAIHYCYKILKIDPYRENIFKKLMQYHFELGNRKEASSIFELCQKNIEKDLGIALSYETKELYRKLHFASHIE